MSEAGHPEGALDGVRVLDMSGPMGVYCGKLLADLGADVIKVEKPGGDPMRSRGPFYHDQAHPEKSLYFFLFNTNKRGVTLDIESADGKAVLKRLVEGVDILLETYPPGYMDSLGLGYADLASVNPGLIVTSVTPFGQTGPYRDYKSSDLVGSAMGGLTNMVGAPGERPAWTLSEIAYHHVNINASSATLIALYHKDSTGEGQHIDVSMHEAISMVVPASVQSWDVLGEVVTRNGGASIRAGFGAFQCKDGYVSVVIRAGPPLVYLCEWLDEDGIEHDLRDDVWHNMTFRSQPENIEHMHNILRPFFMKYTKRELAERAQSHHLSITSYYDPKELREDPHLNARNYFVDVEHPELETTITYAGAPYGLSETPWSIRRRAPLIGEHNEEVYAGELGYSTEQLALLKAAGSI